MILDLTGNNPDNKLTTPIPVNYNGGKIAILIPQGGFFHTSMTSPVLMYNGKRLVYGTDYRYVYKSKDIRAKHSISAHAGIMILNTSVVGQIELTASYLGDSYQVYNTQYVNNITSIDYLLSLYDVGSLTDLPENLPPKAQLLDMENVTSGMDTSVQFIFSLGVYLKDYEDHQQLPSTGYAWPEIFIEDLS